MSNAARRDVPPGSPFRHHEDSPLAVPASATAPYPSGRAARDRFVLARRGPRHAVDPWAPPRVAVDPEPDERGGVIHVTTLFLTGRECPWRCVMCDLWRHTIEGDTPPGASPYQIRGITRPGPGPGPGPGAEPWAEPRAEPRAGARAEPRAQPGAQPAEVRRYLKLYNAGSFFDPRAVPPIDDPAIADAVADMVRVTVESHPRLVGDRTWRFRDLLARGRGGGDRGPALEVAMGLETAHPDALARLNKGCTVGDFAAAAEALAAHGVGLRVFLLVHPPFVPIADREAWLLRSIDVAIAAGASLIALIPTRADPPGLGGAMTALAAQGDFVPPSIADLEHAASQAMRHAAGRARIIVDLWDLPAFAPCATCLEVRRARLLRLGLEQRDPDDAAGDSARCAACGARPGAAAAGPPAA